MDITKLNKKQREAVCHIDGPCIVIAGPGSGKTRVISTRIVNMVNNNISPNKIVAISFTKASSVEMKQRTLSLGGGKNIERVHFSTFHSAFFKILRKFTTVDLKSMFSEKERYFLAKEIMKHLNIENLEDDLVNKALTGISFVKNEMISPKDLKTEDISNEQFCEIYKLYEASKKEKKKIDFDDMLIYTYKLLLNRKDILEVVRQVYKYILIDEFQDINKVQFEIIKMITSPDNNLFVVGDEDQSIYSFRGARPDYMMNFGEIFKGSKKIILDTNYRSDANIVTLSENLIVKNKNRYNKTIKPFRDKNSKVKLMHPNDSEEEADLISNQIIKLVVNNKFDYDDFAVIYRINTQAHAFVDKFMEKKIPFILKDVKKTIYDFWAIKDIISYLMIAVNPYKSEDWARVINKPFRYISKEKVAKASSKKDFFNELMENLDLNVPQQKTLKELHEDLNYIKRLAPQYAISYIRSTLDYDRYILEYCVGRKIKSESIIEKINEFEESSKSFKSIFDFFEHIENVKKELNEQKKMEANYGVTLTTIHGAKGLEFKNVFVIGASEGMLPYVRSENVAMTEEMLEEERRLMYVAVTRAQDNLYVSSPKFKYNKKVKKSIFVDELCNKKIDIKSKKKEILKKIKK